MRFLTSEQIKYWLFEKGSITACRRRLSFLFHNGYLTDANKPKSAGHGSSKRIYCLSKKGAALISLLFGEEEAKQIKWSEKQNKVEVFFIEHTLAINDIWIAFSKAVVATDNYDLIWFKESEIKGWKEKVDDPENSSKTLAITPDAFINLTGNDKKANYFLEVDRATESNRRWRDKVRGYVEYVYSRNYYNKFKSESLRILTVTTSPERLANLMKTTKSVEKANFFLFTTFEQVKNNNVLFDNIWQEPSEKGLTKLVKF